MGLLFNLTIILCLILHVTLTAQFVVTRDQLTRDCKEEDNIAQPKGTTQLVLNQNRCNKSEPSQMFNLSPDTLVYAWKNLNVSNIIQKEDKVMESDIFPITNFEANAKLKITNVSSDGVNVEQHILKIQPLDTWPVKVYSRVTNIMKVEVEGKVIDTSIWTGEFEAGSSLEYGTHIGSNILFDYPYEVTELSLTWEVHVETPEMIYQFYSDNGTIKGSLCPYGKILEWTSAKQIEWIPSPYFYTSPKGYRVSVLFYLDNKSDTKWLYVYTQISPGPYDSNLKQPKWKGKFTLINQKDSSKSITQVEKGSEVRNYSYEALTIAKPSNLSEFVVNDELKYEASIEILD